MALSDPLTITISGVPITCPLTSRGTQGAEYLSSDGLVRLSANHAYGRRTRRVFRVDHNKVTADPFIPAQNVKVGMSHYLVFDVPPAGYTNTEAKAVYDGFKALYTASTDAIITKLLGGES